MRLFLSTLPLIVLSSVGWMALMYMVLAESQVPGLVPWYVIPALICTTLVTTYLGIRQLRTMGGVAVAKFLMLVFLCAIPIYLIMEVTVI